MKDGVKTVGAADMAALFAAGAYSAAASRGMPGKDAERLSMDVCKSASSGEYEDGTLWDRNKGWMIPTIVGGLAFWAGASGERNGRPDRGYFENAWENIMRRVRYLLGFNSDNPTFDAATRIEKERNAGQKSSGKDTNQIGGE